MIIDSSTLILLAKIELLDFFIKNRKLKITKKVEEESTLINTFDAKMIKQRIKENKIQIEEIKSFNFYNQLIKEFNLGKGEAESIVLASEKREVLLTDDKKAINTCKIFNIKFATALNILIYSYRNKMIEKEKANIILKKLIYYGRYSENLIKSTMEDLK